jgi:hypothetical protein
MPSWTMIEPPSRAVRDYLAGFNLGCILIRPSGEIEVARSLARMGPVAALWWVRDWSSAHQVVRAIGEQRSGTVEAAIAEIRAAAVRVDVVLSERSVVVARARDALARLDTKIELARQNGVLQFFNREYQRRRLAARAAGARFMTYGEAKRRLRKLLARAAAGTPIANVLQRVFEG